MLDIQIPLNGFRNAEKLIQQSIENISNNSFDVEDIVNLKIGKSIHKANLKTIDIIDEVNDDILNLLG